jgi:Na+-driven multidrug efflux pump
MISKTETHIAAFSVGAVIFSFLPFLSDAVCQTQTVIISQLLGAKKYFDLFKALIPGTLWTSVAIALFAIPFLLFPQFTFEYLFPTISLPAQTVRMVFLGLWLSFAFFTLLYVPLGYILAFKDMYFSAFMGCFGWLNGFLLMYYFLNIAHIAPQHFWLALSVMHGSSALIYFLRAFWLCQRATKRYLPV